MRKSCKRHGPRRKRLSMAKCGGSIRASNGKSANWCVAMEPGAPAIGDNHGLLQQLITGWVVNVKRLVNRIEHSDGGTAGMLRAGTVATG